MNPPQSFKGAAPSPRPPVPDWPYLVEKSRQEGVSAVLFQHITKRHLEELVPEEALEALAQDYRANLKYNLSAIGRLREVLKAFQQAGLSCIVLKGMDLAEHAYPNLAMRGMSDADLLVKKETLPAADRLLSSLGYAAMDSSPAKAGANPAGYLASLDYRKKESPLNLHVHWHTVNTSVPATLFVNRVDMNRLWDNAVPTQVADSQAFTLRPEHAIIYLCEHALRVGHSFDRLILVCDLFFTIKAFAAVIDWDWLVEESRRFGLSRWVYFSLAIVSHYSGLEIPGRALGKLKPPQISWGERLFLRLQFGDRRIRGSSYLLYLALNRRLPDRVRFIARTFFPPPQILLQRQYRKDAVFSNALYLSRLREGFSHLGKLLAAFGQR